MSSMEHVYVVTQGMYDEYHIVGVFSTIGKAQECYRVRSRGCLCRYDLPRISKWKLDWWNDRKLDNPRANGEPEAGEV